LARAELLYLLTLEELLALHLLFLALALQQLALLAAVEERERSLLET
jgi:hypothetical protein